MARRLPFLFLCLLIVKSVYNLECFVTDTVGLQTNISAPPIAENCTVFFDERGLGALVGDEEDFSCATITTETDTLVINLQICLTANYTCDNWISQNISLGSVGFPEDYDVNCEECQFDLCNGGIEQTFVLKGDTDFINGLYISGASCTAIGVLGVIFLGCFIRKYKNKKRH